MKKVRFDKDIKDPPIKRFCECTGCGGCSFLPCGSKDSPPMWTDIRCKIIDCQFYVCIYCIDVINNEKGFCNYCLRK